MIRDFIGWKDVAVFTSFVSGVGTAGVTTLVMPPFRISPVKDIFILETRTTFYCLESVGSAPVPDAFARVNYDFKNQSNPGIAYDGTFPISQPRLVTKSGLEQTSAIFRNISAGETFDLTSGGRVWVPSGLPTLIWTYAFDVFYLVTN